MHVTGSGVGFAVVLNLGGIAAAKPTPDPIDLTAAGLQGK